MREGELDIGDVLDGKFRLNALLGEGAMGRVFDAQHLFMQRRVAVKLLRGDVLHTRLAVRRFQQEAIAASHIEHPNIVAILDFGIDHETQTPYVVQEFLDGLTLLEHLSTAPGGRLSPREAISIIAPVMSALDAAHRKGVIHRDVKPGNIFLVRDAAGGVVPKIIDFGVAKALTPLMQDAARTHDGQTVGTPLYMSREQAEGVLEIDARTDVWAVGVVLFEMLSGRRPYEGKSATIILGQVLSREPPPMLSLAPQLDPGLAAVVDKALQTDRERRYASMQAFLEDLLACGELGSSAPTTAPETVAAPSSVQTPPAPPEATRRDGSRGPLSVMTLLAILMFLLVCVGGGLLARTPRAPSRRHGFDASSPLEAVVASAGPTGLDAATSPPMDAAEDLADEPPSALPPEIHDSARRPRPERSAVSHRRRLILLLDVFTAEEDPP